MRARVDVARDDQFHNVVFLLLGQVKVASSANWLVVRTRVASEGSCLRESVYLLLFSCVVLRCCFVEHLYFHQCLAESQQIGEWLVSNFIIVTKVGSCANVEVSSRAHEH